MPTRLPLTLACGDYDVNRGLIDGDVIPQGVDLTVLTYPSPQRHWRMARDLEFDVCEFSLASYLVIHGRGEPALTAIPAFPHRRFRHGYVLVNADAGIDRPKDLEGRRIGIRTWQTTAGLWMRGILQDDHDVDLRSIEWVAQDEEDIALEHAGGFRIVRAPAGRTVTELVVAGELDALIYPDMPDPRALGDRVVPLFPDAKQVEMEYARRTGFFPLMHTVVLRRELDEAHPWVARELLAAFVTSKDRAFERMGDPRRVSLAWLREALEEQRRVLGPDPWAYGLRPNRRALETMIRWAAEQGLIAARFEPESLFTPTTREDLPAYV